MYALGIIEGIGITAAASALDAAIKAGKVKMVGTEKVIGAGKAVSVSIYVEGDVAAVKAAVEAGKKAGEKVGKILTARVIPRPGKGIKETFSYR